LDLLGVTHTPHPLGLLPLHAPCPLGLPRWDCMDLLDYIQVVLTFTLCWFGLSSPLHTHTHTHRFTTVGWLLFSWLFGSLRCPVATLQLPHLLGFHMPTRLGWLVGYRLVTHLYPGLHARCWFNMDPLDWVTHTTILDYYTLHADPVVRSLPHLFAFGFPVGLPHWLRWTVALPDTPFGFWIYTHTLWFIYTHTHTHTHTDSRLYVPHLLHTHWTLVAHTLVALWFTHMVTHALCTRLDLHICTFAPHTFTYTYPWIG